MATIPARRSLICALLLGVCAQLGCGHLSVDPKPTLEFPEGPRRANVLGELSASLEVTASIDRAALERPDLSNLVDAQIAAMMAYVRLHGRGTIDESTLQVDEPDAEQPVHGRFSRNARDPEVHRALRRLGIVGVQLASYLSLQSGPRELGQVAVSTVVHELGQDAVLLPSESERHGGTDLALDQRDGVAYLAVRHLLGDIADRASAVLSQWAANDKPPRALVLDLSRCETGSPESANALLQALAPGKLAFELESRDPQTGQRERHAFRGDPEWGSHAFVRVPLFVVTSTRTDSFAEAVARALQRHRGAAVLGAAPAGDGRVMGWVELPWKARFGFTVAQLLDTDGKPVRGTLLVPDACMSQGQLVPLATRDAGEYRTRCDMVEALPAATAIDYARSALSAAPASAPAASEHGGLHS